MELLKEIMKTLEKIDEEIKLLEGHANIADLLQARADTLRAWATYARPTQ